MKEKLWRTFKFFAGSLLPLCWLGGGASAMLYQNINVKSNFFLYGSMDLAMIIVMGSVVDYMKLREIKGGYAFGCMLGAIVIFILSLWIYLV